MPGDDDLRTGLADLLADRLAGRALVLASGSSARAAVLREAGVAFVVDRPSVDERSWDHLLVEEGPAPLAVHLAVLKADAVVPRHPQALVLAADQVGVLDTADGPRLLQQRPTVESATAQLFAMSGTTHQLVNGLVLVDSAAGRRVTGVDVQIVSMRRFDERSARRYVERFEPFESAGSYRIEDQALMTPEERLLEDVVGEHDSGVRGLPLPLLCRMLAELQTVG